MANGKIKADTLEHSTAGSLDTSYVVNGSAKRGLTFDGTATNIREFIQCFTVKQDVSTAEHKYLFTNA